MRNEPIDFIGVPHYHMGNRSADEDAHADQPSALAHDQPQEARVVW
jgi:hypothetical protein